MNKTIKIKRPVVVKTIVTPEFKTEATSELKKEINLLESQIMQVEIQNKQIQDQMKRFEAQADLSTQKQMHDMNNELTNKIINMNSLKQELISEINNIHNLAINNEIVTGSLENYVELQIGENLYDKFKNAEIIVKNGIIQQIIE